MSIENDLGQPTFQWSGSTYNFIPSISEFQRDLDTGGFQIVKLLTATIRKYDWYSEEPDSFPQLFITYPTAQNIITYSLDNTTYRIESIKHDPTNSYMRIVAHSTTKMM